MSFFINLCTITYQQYVTSGYEERDVLVITRSFLFRIQLYLFWHNVVYRLFFSSTFLHANTIETSESINFCNSITTPKESAWEKWRYVLRPHDSFVL